MSRSEQRDAVASSETGWRYGRVALMGLGVSTQAAADYLLALPAGSFEALDAYMGDRPKPRVVEQARSLASRGVCVREGSVLDEEYDLGIVSPGVPAMGAFYASALRHCAELVSEPELAWRASPQRWVGITGTNGKTTTTSLATQLLRASGVPARPVGNIGLPPLACVLDRGPEEVFVAELSSFQLESSVRLAPHVGVLLNVTPDHVEWHGSLDAYARAKERLFANMGADDLAVLGQDEVCREVTGRLRARGVRTIVLGEEAEGAPDAAWLDAEGRLVVRLRGEGHVLCSFDDLAIKGPHNALNALAACACALEMGADDESVIAGLVAFAPLEHRIEPCGEVRGVRFYDDSKGTNVDATEKALGAFAPGTLVLMLGGHDKGTDLSEFAPRCLSAARVVVTYGEAGERFRQVLEAARAAEGVGDGCVVESAPHMREAFDVAVRMALPGDTVLLSPACSSYDEFSGYEERGRTFKRWVGELEAASAAGGSL